VKPAQGPLDALVAGPREILQGDCGRVVLPRLPPGLRPVVEHGLAVYRGEAEESWAGLPVDDYVAYLVERLSR
jgi:hypothetical protein